MSAAAEPPARDGRAVSFGLGVGGCCAYVASGPAGTPRGCTGQVTHAGLVMRARRDAEHPAETWRSFACSAHAGHLVAPRLLLDRDREVLAEWQAEAARWTEKRWPTPADPWRRPGPLAVGPAAFELLDRAARWAELHGGG